MSDDQLQELRVLTGRLDDAMVRLAKLEADVQNMTLGLAKFELSAEHASREVSTELRSLVSMVTTIAADLKMVTPVAQTAKATSERLDGWVQKIATAVLLAVLAAVMTLVLNPPGG